MSETSPSTVGGRSVTSTIGVVADVQTYKNLLYLLLSFPLGMVYFIFLTVGLSLGAALSVLVVGIGILFVVVLGSRVLASFERWLANTLLGTNLAAPNDITPADDGSLIDTGVAYLSAASTWKGMGYLVLKFPLGLLSFILLVGMLGTAIELLVAPVAPGLLGVQVNDVEIASLVETPAEMAGGVVVGLVLGFVSLHVLNAFARVTRQVTVALLGPNANRERL